MSSSSNGGLVGGGPSLVIKGSWGLSLREPPAYADHQNCILDDSKTCKALQFSPDGSKLAWSNSTCLQVASQDQGGWKVTLTLPLPKVNSIQWSPLGKVLATWEPYSTVAGQEPRPNLHLWDIATGEKLKSFFQKKISNWCPMWSKDEKICSRIVTNEVQFYLDGDYHNIHHKIHLQKITDYSMSTNIGRTNVVTYVPGSKGAPSFCKMYQFPNFDDNQVIANKSFYQADNVELMWNSLGTGVLLLTQAEVDKTGGSYYGKQALHYMTSKGDTAMVSLTKEGPIYSVTWNPAGDKFAAVYGFMPAKAALFNQKADLIFDYGSGPKNMAMFNPQGNILMLGGFGNLRGRIEMWDPANNERISQFDAPDSTDVKWNPDGQHLLTTICAPRLRQGNGYKIWHYTGALMHENPKPISPPEELWEGVWQLAAPGTHPTFRISKQMVQGIAPSQPQESKQVYRPPGARGAPSTFRLHDDDDDLPSKKDDKKEESLSKTAQKNKKRREAAKRKKEEETEVAGGGGGGGTDASKANSNHAYQGAAGLLFDPEKEKKIRKIKDKLKSIDQLKSIQNEGKTLEKNQLEKMSKEAELLAELEKLRV